MLHTSPPPPKEGGIMERINYRQKRKIRKRHIHFFFMSELFFPSSFLDLLVFVNGSDKMVSYIDPIVCLVSRHCILKFPVSSKK